MTDEGRQELTQDERQRFAALPHELPPPVSLEDRVVRALTLGRLIHTGSRRWRPAASLAAGLALVLAGFGVGRLTIGPGAVPPGPHFLLLVYDGSAFDPGGRSEAELVAEYGAWAERLAAEGHLVAAEKLAAGGRVLGGTGGNAVAAPEDVAKGALGELGGFFLIAARDSMQAHEIARDSPHVRYGGVIVVRGVVETR